MSATDKGIGMFVRRNLIISLAGLTLLTHPAHAATISPLAVPDASSILAPPTTLPELPKREVPKLKDNLNLPDGSSKLLSFKIARVRIVGATKVDPRVIAKLFDPMLNKPVASKDLKAALDQVTRIYADTGYALGRAYIPVQVMSGGTLIVRVVEGYIGRITIKTESDAARAVVARFGRHITDEKPLRRETLERFLLLMSDVPGITVKGQLTGMDIYTGMATMALVAEQEHVSTNMALDSRSNVKGLPFQVYLTGAINNILGNGEKLALTTLASWKLDTQKYFRLAYSTLLGSDGLSLTTSASYARSETENSVYGYVFASHSKEVDTTLSYPLIRSKSENLYGGIGGYVSDVVNDLNGSRFSEDAIRAVFADLRYTKTISPTLAIGATARVTQGLGVFNAGPSEMLHSRLGARPWFTKARVSANVNYALDDDWLLSSSVEGQYSPNSLYASEEISFGGSRFGRGFDTSEISGDSGYGASVQLQYQLKTNWIEGWNLRPYTFLDQSGVYNKSIDRQGNDRLVSTGLGLSVSNQSWLAVTVEMDKPLNRDVFSQGNRNPRGYISFQARL